MLSSSTRYRRVPDAYTAFAWISTAPPVGVISRSSMSMSRYWEVCSDPICAAVNPVPIVAESRSTSERSISFVPSTHTSTRLFAPATYVTRSSISTHVSSGTVRRVPPPKVVGMSSNVYDPENPVCR
jgi:hypothetical protein